jgi:hypothetical protein
MHSSRKVAVMQMRINGQLLRMVLTYHGIECELGGRVVGVFPTMAMASEAVVHTIEHQHVRSVA